MTDGATIARFAEAVVNLDATIPSGVAARGEYGRERGFSVYRNNIQVGLVDALARTFPVSLRLVGEPFFRGMARRYVADNKPRDPVLLNYGDTFGDFIEGFVPAQGLPYLSDVARLEFAWQRAYHAADAQALTFATLETKASTGSDVAWIWHPAARIVASPFPVGSIWLAHQTDTVGDVGSWDPEMVLISRPEMAVSLTVLAPPIGAFACALWAGSDLHQATALASQAWPDFDPGRSFGQILALGGFAIPGDEGATPR